MSANAPITLQDVQNYARRYFPLAFSKLPSVESLRWESASPNATGTRSGIQFASVKLFVGRHQYSQEEIWAHQSLQNSYDVHTISNGRATSGFTVEYFWKYISTHAPFQYAHSSDGREFDTLCRYYFLAKGLIPRFPRADNALGKFEWAVRSVAQEAALDISSNGLGNDSAKKMHEVQTLLRKRADLAVMKKSPANSIQSTPKVHDPVTPSATSSGKRKRLTESPTSKTIIQEGKLQGSKSYVDNVKDFLKKQEVEAKKIIEDMKTLTAEKDMFAAQVKLLQSQLLEEKDRRLNAEYDAANNNERYRSEWVAHGKTLRRLREEKDRRDASDKVMETELTTEKRLRAVADNKSSDAEKKAADAEKKAADAEKKAADAEQKASEAETNLQSYRNTTQTKLKKASDLYANQKELLEQVARYAVPEKDAILKSLEEEYGELAQD